MNELQYRLEFQYKLWKNMIDIIDSYIDNENQEFADIVSQLQGDLDASEIEDRNLVRQWYSFWDPLEILVAVEDMEGRKVHKAQALPYLIAMKKFLVEHLGKPPQTERQYQLWKSMVDVIDSYMNNETQDFSGTVGKLEEALDPSEFKDIDLISKWYAFWVALESRRATEGNEVNKPEAIKELMAMKEFLLSYLAKPAQKPR